LSLSAQNITAEMFDSLLIYDCEDLGKEIIANPSVSIWDYSKDENVNYECLGNYLAKNDIRNNILIIHSYGSPGINNICKICMYKELGISFEYYYDIIYEHKTAFMTGYNNVVKGYIKEKYGKTIFDSINHIETSKIEPYKFFSSIKSDKINNYIDITKINDSLINVKLDLDSVAKSLNLDFTNLTMELSNDFNGEKTEVRYDSLKLNGYDLKQNEKGKFLLCCNFNFSNVENICYCEYAEKYFSKLIIPIKIE